METSNESTALQIEHDTLQEVIYDKNVNYEVIHHGGLRGWGFCTKFYTGRLHPLGLTPLPFLDYCVRQRKLS